MSKRLLSLYFLVAACFFAVSSERAQAQQFYDIGNGTSNPSPTYAAGGPADSPYWDFYYGQRTQYVIKASDLQFYGMSAGQIVSLAMQLVGGVQWPAARSFTIQMKQTPLTAAPSTFDFSDQTTVADLQNYFPVLNAWNTYNFNTPFLWDGVSNLMITFCSNRAGWTSNYPTISAVTTSYTTVHYGYEDNAVLCAQSLAGAIQGTSTGRPLFRFGVLSGLEASFPDDVDPRRILRAGDVYGGQDAAHPRPSLTFRTRSGQNVNLTYRIVGPLPSTNVIYKATTSGGDPNITYSSVTTGLVTYNFTNATGPAAGPNGILDLTSVTGGAYRVEATYSIPNYNQTWTKEFSIAYPNDLSVRAIVSPIQAGPPRNQKYPRGIPIPISGRFQNVGLNAVTDFRAIATITGPGGQIVYRDTVIYDQTKPALNTADVTTIDFKEFSNITTGYYTLQICSELMNASDNQSGNNCLPGSGSYPFEIQYNIEVEAVSVTRPVASGTYYTNRPIRPLGLFRNNGIQYVSDMPAQMIIYRIENGNPVEVYNRDAIVPDIRPGTANETSQDFPYFTPTQPGSYRVCIIAKSSDDQIKNNDQVCGDFTVVPSLSGTFTIGTLKAGDVRNFNTIQDAVDALFIRGVDGPVVFEFTDANYTAGDVITAGKPAVDLSTKVIGMSATNTVTFRPSIDRSTVRAGVNIALRSNAGIGIRLGESYSSTNLNSAFFERKIHEYANGTGYFIFEGGSQKALRFTLESSNPHRSVFYLGRESNNTTISNVIIENSANSSPSYITTLPLASYNGTTSQFIFSGDPVTRPSAPTGVPTINFSAGIVMRNVPTPLEDRLAVSEPTSILDTVTSNNNRIIGNEISGFGYGVVGIGIGPLYSDRVNGYQSYYTKGTEIRDNTIYNVRRAGIFVAYQDGALISGNRIFNVGSNATGGGSTEAAGIMAGGAAGSNYNNFGLRIERNEISGVTSDLNVRGISVEQYQARFLTGSNKLFIFPEVDRNTAMSNIVWGMTRTAPAANLSGIHFTTLRSGITVASQPQYFTMNDTVANNTIIMSNDAVAGTGLVAGIAVQQGQKTAIYNNAIAMNGAANASTFGNAALFLQTGMKDFTSNNNAFWTPNATIARMLEVDNQSRALSSGSYNEYVTLAQWKSATAQDRNSVYGDFTQDHQFVGTTTATSAPRLRVKTNPTPIGSILNNRGERLASLGLDIDGELRQTSGQRPDIGADEFQGRLFVNDIESVEILTPASYRATTGIYNDAEYVMTTAPVNVTARARNSGSLAQSAVEMRLRVYAETQSSNNTMSSPAVYSGSPVIDRTVTVNLPAGEYSDLNFRLDNGAQKFAPQTFAQLGSSWTIPAQFATMGVNVTPRYRIELSSTSDENNTNNVASKEVRFYVMQSPSRVMVSVEGTTINTPTLAADIAGRLNADSLVKGMSGLGWAVNPSTGTYSYDLFDRRNWEPRAVDYTPYRTLIWGDDMSALSRSEREDIRDFVGAGQNGEKKNLVIGSQEIARKHIGLDPINDEDFVRQILRTQNSQQQTTPVLAGYNGLRVIGMTISEGTAEWVRSTGYPGDAAPMPALVRTYSDPTTQGVARGAYRYETRASGVTDSLMGVATAGISTNVVYLGVDWRHYARTTGVSRSGVERVLRGVLDFFDKNGSPVLDVNVTEFEAQKLRTGGKWHVNVSWTAVSEAKVARYEVERSEAGVIVSRASGAGRYAETDMNVEAGRSYVYRLVAVGRDGRRTVEGEQSVMINGDERGESASWISQPSPSPVVSEGAVSFTASESGVGAIVIYDVDGREVGRQSLGQVEAGKELKATLNAGSLVSGSYIYALELNGVQVARQQMQVVR